MRQSHFLTLPETDKEAIFQEISNETGMPAFAVEKGWWVSRTLDIIFQMDIGQHLVFKGGTSLSKAWNLIDRFSEDIDLAIDKDFLFSPSKGWSKKEITRLRKEAGAFSTGKFFLELQERFMLTGFTSLNFDVIPSDHSDQDPRIIEIYYPNIIRADSSYLKPRIQIEIGCRSLKEPYSIRTFGSLVDEIYSDRKFADPLFHVPTVDSERTFLEKIFLLHEEFSRPTEKVRVDRLSRHLYDVYQLSKAGIADRAIADKILYQTIVAHRHKFASINGVDYNSHNPQTINPTPIPQVWDAWKKDYKKMKVEMIYGAQPPSFDQLIENLEQIKYQLRKIEWRFDLQLS